MFRIPRRVVAGDCIRVLSWRGGNCELPEHEIIPVHDLVVRPFLHQLADLGGLFSADLVDVFGAVVGQAAGDGPAGGVDDVYDVAAEELAGYLDDAGGK